MTTPPVGATRPAKPSPGGQGSSLIVRARRSTLVKALVAGTALWLLVVASYLIFGAVGIAWAPCVALAWIALKVRQIPRTVAKFSEQSGREHALLRQRLTRIDKRLDVLGDRSKRELSEIEGLAMSTDRLFHRTYMQSAQLAAFIADWTVSNHPAPRGDAAGSGPRTDPDAAA